MAKKHEFRKRSIAGAAGYGPLFISRRDCPIGISPDTVQARQHDRGKENFVCMNPIKRSGPPRSPLLQRVASLWATVACFHPFGGRTVCRRAIFQLPDENFPRGAKGDSWQGWRRFFLAALRGGPPTLPPADSYALEENRCVDPFTPSTSKAVGKLLLNGTGLVEGTSWGSRRTGVVSGHGHFQPFLTV